MQRWEEKMTVSFKLLLENRLFPRGFSQTLSPLLTSHPHSGLPAEAAKEPALSAELSGTEPSTPSGPKPLLQRLKTALWPRFLSQHSLIDNLSCILKRGDQSRKGFEGRGHFFRYFPSSSLLSYILKAQVGSISIKGITYLLVLWGTLPDSLLPFLLISCFIISQVQN